VRPGARFCSKCGEDLEPGTPEWQRRGVVPADCEPHRAQLVLLLGSAGIVLALLHILFIAGLPLSLAAWSMARRDLKLMDARQMDPGGRTNTRRGQLCGIIGTLIGTIWLVVFSWLGLSLLMKYPTGWDW
jgi:hypothetical protein